MESNRILSLIAACGFVLMAALSSARASAQNVEPDHLRIMLDTKRSQPLPKARKAQTKYQTEWRAACHQLGKAMTVGRGVWGFGAFRSYSCYIDSRLVGGAKRSARWALDVIDGAKEASFSLSYIPPGGTKIELGKHVLPPSKSTMAFFADDEFTDLVSYSLMDQMPMGMMVTKSMIKGNPPQFVGRYQRKGRSPDFKYKVPSPPEDLVLFRLSWDNQAKAWRSMVVGTAKLDRVIRPSRAEKPRGAAATGQVTYKISADANEALAIGPLWAQAATGPSGRQQELTKISSHAHSRLDAAARDGQLPEFLEGKLRGLVDSLLDTAAFGYVGLRYGLQVLSGDDLLAKTSMVGLLVELRGGPLQGLRYYYDKLPKTTASLDGQNGEKLDTSIEWSRHVLGFSLGLEPSFLVSRITLDPKVGLWSFKATLPTEKDAENRAVQVDTFNLGNTASVALEVGLEWLSDWYTVRTWYAIDTGFSLLSSGGTVTSNRMGVDAYFTAGPTIPVFGVPFKTALLAFYMYESVSLERKDDKIEEGKVSATGVNYDGAYAGGGVAISW